MSWLVDTNVLLRLADTKSPEHSTAALALERLIAEGALVFLSVQVLVEFWAVATRPESANGLGWPAPVAAGVIRDLRSRFLVLTEPPDVVDNWLELVETRQVAGKRTHDARLAALVLTAGISGLLTFNTADFPPVWGIQAVSPRQLLHTPN